MFILCHIGFISTIQFLYHWNRLQLQSKYVVFIFRQQHDWQPKGEQKKTGGQSWQGLPPNISSSTWTSPSYGQPMVNSQSNMTTQSTLINSQQPPVNIDPRCLVQCCLHTPPSTASANPLVCWFHGWFTWVVWVVTVCCTHAKNSWKHHHIGIARAGILLPQFFF